MHGVYLHGLRGRHAPQDFQMIELNNVYEVV